MKKELVTTKGTEAAYQQGAEGHHEAGKKSFALLGVNGTHLLWKSICSSMQQDWKTKTPTVCPTE